MAVDEHHPPEAAASGVRRLYTPAMLAELLALPVGVVRRWHRQGVLQAVRFVQRLPYFDFQEVAVARRLASLLKAGCSLRTIDRRLAELAQRSPGQQRPWADPAVVAEGRRLYLRRGDDLAEPGGQLLLDFDGDDRASADDGSPTILSIGGRALRSPNRASAAWDGDSVDELQQAALDLEEAGDLHGAAEAYRTILMAAGPQAEVHFALADVLYRAGDLSAARERFYAALELDEEYVEARASLGCVLAESGELELAAEAFAGALAHHSDFADVHFHMASVLERLDRPDEAQHHLRQFLDLAPESPWAAAARQRLGEPSVIRGD